MPLGVGAAIYMEEYARDTKLTRFINTNIRNLAGVPAIVYGILGLAVFVKLLKPVTGPGTVNGQSLLAGGLTIALMVLPIIIITTQEALRAVPKGIREGGFGVGATRWEVIRSHVLPNAAPGILTGSVLRHGPRARRDGPAHHGRRGDGVPRDRRRRPGDRSNSGSPSLPTLIFAYVKKPEPRVPGTCGRGDPGAHRCDLPCQPAAILLRNRYERKW